MNLIGRRTFLAGLGLGAGSPLLGSIFETSLLPQALGAPARKRLFLITNGNGFIEKSYTCAARSETDFDLNPVFEPLAPWKSQLVVASRFHNPFDRALHGNQFATLSVIPSPNQTGEKRGPPGGISIDRFLAKQIGAKDAFPSTAQGLAEGRNILCTSCDGLNQPFPAIGSPVKAYETYFGGAAGATAGAGQAPDVSKQLAQDKSLLDLIAGDIARMQGRLAGPEKAKLDQYLTSIRGVERQLAELGAARGTCQAPPRPGADLDRASLSPRVVAAHIDVAFAAQMCGLTRISHMSILGMEGPHIAYGWLGDTRGHHNTHHAGDYPTIQKIDTFIISCVAQVAAAMSKIAEPGGSMLDNSLVAYINTCGGRHHGGQDTHAVVTVGRAGGAMKGGRYLQYPLKKHCISDLYVSWANAFDVPITTFGDPKHCTGALPGYLS
jgi:hypothetical protein